MTDRARLELLRAEVETGLAALESLEGRLAPGLRRAVAEFLKAVDAMIGRCPA